MVGRQGGVGLEAGLGAVGGRRGEKNYTLLLTAALTLICACMHAYAYK